MQLLCGRKINKEVGSLPAFIYIGTFVGDGLFAHLSIADHDVTPMRHFLADFDLDIWFGISKIRPRENRWP